MPNWCHNTFKIHGAPSHLDALLEAAKKDDEHLFSLEKLVPCPEPLRGITSGSDEMGYEAKYGPDEKWQEFAEYPWMVRANEGEPIKTREECLRALAKARPGWVEMAEQYKRNVDEYGATTWYDWCCDNWGTKWDLKVDHITRKTKVPFDVSFKSDTAWSPPIEAFLKISEQYPELEFTIKYSEPHMRLRGTVKIMGGQQVDG